jgi:hypothetical protein
MVALGATLLVNRSVVIFELLSAGEQLLATIMMIASRFLTMAEKSSSGREFRATVITAHSQVADKIC